MCGLWDIEKQMEMDAAYKKKRVELMLKELENMLNAISELREKADTFEQTYGEVIEVSPDYSEKAAAIAQELGISMPGIPFSDDMKEKPGLVERLTGRGRFYDELGLQILDIAKQRREATGGIMTLAEIVLMVNKQRRTSVSQVDVSKAIQNLAGAKLIPGIRKLPSGIRIVELVPRELTNDQVAILSLASRTGYTTLEEVMTNTEWTQERADAALKSLEAVGAAKIDKSFVHGTRYFFPGLNPE
ncbi:MAG: EAP30/Vps36 family vacuolar-sorting protein [Candidatus Thorarchaeota archaeon]